MQPKIIVILGPTASGKSALAVKLAKKIKGEIISADSRQVYKGMDIGSGKITRKEMGGVPHHLLDVASPKKTFTVAQYQKLGQAAIKKILSKGKVPIICGGTGLYIDALLHNYSFPSVPPDQALRKKLEKLTTEKLFEELERLDPARAKSIDRHNRRRLVRAIEIVMKTKKPVPKLGKESPYEVLKIGINPSKEKLAANIKTRLAKRMKHGLVNEIKKLHSPPSALSGGGGGVSWKRLDNFGLEYRFVSRYVRGLISKDDMIAAIETESMKCAKRQMTWFKKDSSTHWIQHANDGLLSVNRFLHEKLKR